MDGESQLVWGMISSCQKSCSNFLFVPPFPSQREPFGDSNPGRDAESPSPGEKSCLRLQKAYLQQAVLVTFIKIEHWAFLLPCFLCFWQEVVIVKDWLHCAQWCSEKYSCPQPWRRQESSAGWTEEDTSFPQDPSLFHRLWRSVRGSRRETCYVTAFSQPSTLSCTPSRSIRQSVVSGGRVCHNLLGTAHSRYWRRGQKINKLDWAARPRGRSPYPGLHCSGSTLLRQASLFTAVWVISSRGPNLKRRYFCFADFHLPFSRRKYNHMLSVLRKSHCLHLIL